MSKYLANWNDDTSGTYPTNWRKVSGYEAMLADFEITSADVKDSEIVFARYTYENYEGEAEVVFIRDGKIYEVHGSHCSCYGLEGLWKPIETEKAALLKYTLWSDEERKLLEAINV